MSAFEKWLKHFYSTHRGNMRFQPDSKVGWNAALEWVLRIENELAEQYDSPISMGEVIKQELERAK